jgi:hypothetical protein
MLEAEPEIVLSNLRGDCIAKQILGQGVSDQAPNSLPLGEDQSLPKLEQPALQFRGIDAPDDQAGRTLDSLQQAELRVMDHPDGPDYQTHVGMGKWSLPF